MNTQLNNFPHISGGENNTHGGRRIPGPGKSLGRIPKPKEEKYVQSGLKLPPDVDQWLRKNTTNRNGFIVGAIRAAIANTK